MAEGKYSNKRFGIGRAPPAKVPTKSNTTEPPFNPAPPMVPYIEPANYVDGVDMTDIKPYMYFGVVVLGAWLLIRFANRS